MNLPIKKAFFNNSIFDVFPDVYLPAEDSFFFAEKLSLLDNFASVLDMGTGSGILAIVAAKKSRNVVAIDLNPFAIRCANNNAKKNGVNDKIQCFQGDLFSALNENVTFDLILFNSPYLPSEESETNFWLGRSWAGGINGRNVIDKFILNVSSYLKKTGQILLLQSTLSNVDQTMEIFSTKGFEAQILDSYPLAFFEKLVLIKAQHSQ
ncbi:MAG: methyltransferase [Crenarchaeota archaeon]|nr:methyltransferase [Thermoproteota archaeon]